eukprot:4005594-Karenia_brevis.AAC.1
MTASSGEGAQLAEGASPRSAVESGKERVGCTRTCATPTDNGKRHRGIESILSIPHLGPTMCLDGGRVLSMPPSSSHECLAALIAQQRTAEDSGNESVGCTRA